MVKRKKWRERNWTE